MTSRPATVILVAHGSRVTDANDAHRDLAGRLAELTERDVRPAFLELAEPDVPTAIDDAVAAGATTLVLLPYFLLPGSHTTRDLPQIVADATERHPTATITQAAHLGDDPALVDALVAQIGRIAP